MDRAINYTITIFFKTINYVILRRVVLSIIWSIVSLFIVFLNILDFGSMLSSTNMIVPLIFFNFLLFISFCYTILFLPLYPLILSSTVNLTLLEKIVITIVSNLAIYIIIGIIGGFLNMSLTSFYFYMSTLLIFCIAILVFIIRSYKENSINCWKSVIGKKVDNKSFKNLIMKLLKSNSFYLMIFVGLICILDIVRVEIFVGTDGWLHISIIKYISELNVFPPGDYFGTYGLHVFGTIIHYYSGIDIILIPRYFVFYTFPVSALLQYVFFKRIFRNKNLAILGVFILMFTSLGFSTMMYQFWPSSIVLIQGITIFFLLYVRIQNFVDLDIPSWKKIFSHLDFYYPLVILIFLSSLFSHSLITMIILVSILWIYLIYFAISPRRGFDFLLLCFLVLVFLAFYISGLGAGHIIAVVGSLGDIPIQYLVITSGGIGIIISAVLLYSRKRVRFTKGRFELVITGDKFQILKKIEEKYLIPTVSTLAIGGVTLFSIANILWFNLNILDLIAGFELALIILFSVWGFLTFRLKPKATPLWFWGIASVVLLLLGVIFDVITGSYSYSSRIFYINSTIFAIGFVSYIYQQIKAQNINSLRIKFVLTFIITFSLIITYSNEAYAVEIWSLDEHDVSLMEGLANYTENTPVLISEFGWDPAYMYFSNLDDSERSLESYVIIMNSRDQFLKPELHVVNGSNILRDLKHQYNTSVFLIVSKQYYTPSSASFFSSLTDQEIEEYYNLPYLNRIFSSKRENGEDTPLYWII